MGYDRTSKNNSWKGIVFKEGRFLQSAELNEMQSIQRRDVKNISKAIIDNGGILKGGNVSVLNGYVEIESSLVFIDGYTVDIPFAKIRIPKKGKFEVGSSLSIGVLTADDDSSLLNPAIESDGYKEIGGDRIVVTGRWCSSKEVKKEEIFHTTYTFKDGILQNIKHVAPELEGFKKVIKRYDFDANGSYVARGLISSYESLRDGSHIVSVSDGVGHVNGHEIIFDYAQKVKIEPMIDYDEVIAEPLTYSTDKHYKLRHTPVRKVARVFGIAEKTEDIVHGGYVGAVDSFSVTPVVKILYVRQGQVEYKENIDFTLSGDRIDWSLSGDEPSPSTTYTVKYEYQKHIDSPESTSAGLNLTGFKNNTTVNVTYSYFLKRIDTIVLTKKGDLKVVKGTSQEFSPLPSKINFGLTLSTVEVTNDRVPLVSVDFHRAYLMSDIHKMYNEISHLKYNVAKLSLDTNARSIDPTTIKKNIFVDPLYDDDLRDIGIPQSAVIVDESLRVGIDFKTYNFSLKSDLTLAVKDEETLISQLKFTNSRKINAYISAEEAENVMVLNPSTYRWVSKTNYYSTWWGKSTTTVKELSSQVTVPQVDIEISARSFADETVKIYIDDIYIKSVKSSLIESTGKYSISTKIKTPATLKSGRSLIKCVGDKSKIVVAELWSATPLVKNITTRIRWYDPVAETIFIEDDVFVSSVSLHLKVKPTTFLRVTLCETTVGIPNMKKIVTSKTIDASKTLTDWNKIVLDTPVFMEGGIEYALVVECGDSIGEVSTAKLGEFDYSTDSFMNTQAYDGVLLTSANSSTWTPWQKEDITFKLENSKFENQTEIVVGTVEAVDVTDLYLLAILDLKEETDISFFVVLDNKEVINISPYMLKTIKKYTGKMTLKARLKTENILISPTLDKDISLSLGKVNKVSKYIGKTFQLDGDEVKIYLDVNESSPSVKVFIKDGENYKEAIRDNSENKQLADGYIETCFKATCLSSESNLMIELDGMDVRPLVKHIRVIIG